MEICFAMKEKGCGALECGCPGFDECPFYRTRAEVDASRKKANERIRRLPRETQEHISETYYFGRMPWLEKAAGTDV